VSSQKIVVDNSGKPYSIVGHTIVFIVHHPDPLKDQKRYETVRREEENFPCQIKDQNTLEQ